MLRELAEIKGFHRSPVVFDDIDDGSQTVQLQTCYPLAQLIEAGKISEKKNSYIRVWIGQPLKSSEPIKLLFERGYNRNFLFLSKLEDHLLGTVASVIACILASHYERKLKIHIINGLSSDSENIEYIEQLAKLDHRSLDIISRTESLKPLLSSMSSLIQIRNNPNLIGLDDEHEDHFLVFVNIERFSELNLKRPNLGFGKEDSKETVQNQLKRVFDEGSEAGIFSIVCTGSPKYLENYVEKKTLDRFSMKATGPLDLSDSDKLINSSAAAKLGNNEWMVFYDEDNPGEYSVFRTYQKPQIDWLKMVIRGIRYEN